MKKVEGGPEEMWPQGTEKGLCCRSETSRNAVVGGHGRAWAVMGSGELGALVPCSTAEPEMG